MLRCDISSTIHISFRVAYFEWYAVASAAAVIMVVVGFFTFHLSLASCTATASIKSQI